MNTLLSNAICSGRRYVAFRLAWASKFTLAKKNFMPCFKYPLSVLAAPLEQSIAVLGQNCREAVRVFGG